MALSIFPLKEDQDEDDLLAVDFFNEDRGFYNLLKNNKKIALILLKVISKLNKY